MGKFELDFQLQMVVFAKLRGHVICMTCLCIEYAHRNFHFLQPYFAPSKLDKIRFWDNSQIPDDAPAKKLMRSNLDLPFDLIPIEIYFVRFLSFVVVTRNEHLSLVGH